MSQTPEQKPAFQVSQEIQEGFVNDLAQTMARLAEKKGALKSSIEMPFSAVSSREFSGANMVRLMLAGIEHGYSDNRWMSFKQLEQFQRDNPDMSVHIRKGEKGTKVLWPQEVSFTVTDGVKEVLSQKRLDEIEGMKQAGLDVPEVKKGVLFYQYTVFNAAQIEGFPAKEKASQSLSLEDKQTLVDQFVAASGVRVTYTDAGSAHYAAEADKIVMPGPERYGTSGALDFSAAKLRELFHASGHKDRENRLPAQNSSIKPYALEEMRAELFSIMAGRYLDLPMADQNSASSVQKWNTAFTGGDASAIFKAATEAGKFLTTLHQFKEGEKPKAKWFPPADRWEELNRAQAEVNERHSATTLLKKSLPVLSSKLETSDVARDIRQAIDSSSAPFETLKDKLVEARQCLMSEHFADNGRAVELATRIKVFNERLYDSGSPRQQDSPVEQKSSAPQTPDEKFAQAVQEFDSAQDPVLQVRMILRNPEFLEMALKQDPECARELANLCDGMGMALHMELDQRAQQPTPQENQASHIPAPTVSAPRMRM